MTNDVVLRNELITRHNQIRAATQERGINSVSFYTDGSHISNKNENSVSMGCGWICATFPDIHLHHSLSHWPSSTRAELASIWTALLTIPIGTTVKIHKPL